MSRHSPSEGEPADDITKCVSGGIHWWGLWHQIADIINIDDGSTGGYVYCSECTVCTVRRKVKKLKSVDEPVIYSVEDRGRYES